MPENLFKFSKSSIFETEIPFKNIILAALLTNILAIGLVFLMRKNYLPPEVPLFYGLPEGEAQLAPSINLIFPSILSLVVISLNILLISVIKDGFLKNTLSIVSLIVTFFSLITTIKIVFLVGGF